MHQRIIVSVLAVLLLSAASTTTDLTLLKAIYTPANGSDREYGQGAIERNELAHREIERNIWLIRVPDDTGPEAWQQRLNESVAPEHGSFRVVLASEDERKRVESGEITLQK